MYKYQIKPEFRRNGTHLKGGTCNQEEKERLERSSPGKFIFTEIKQPKPTANAVVKDSEDQDEKPKRGRKKKEE